MPTITENILTNYFTQRIGLRSDERLVLHLLMWFFLFFNLPPLMIAQSAVRLAWTPNSEPDLSHYRLYRDTIPGTLVYLDSISGNDSTYTDEVIVSGTTYYYKLTALNFAGLESEPSNEVMAIVGLMLPENFMLNQNYPNPFNPGTMIAYMLPRPSRVEIVIYDLLGKEIMKLVNEFKKAGTYKVSWDGINEEGQKLSSGLYFYHMTAENYYKTKKMLLLK